MKAILVIDMPKNCDECRLHLESSGGQYRRFCVAKNEISVGKKKPKWCPLKPIHALKSCGHDYIIYERQYLYENLERECELMKEAREYESHISD